MANTEERVTFAVARVGGNYILDDETDHRVRAAIYGEDWWHCRGDNDLYHRTMTALWNKLPRLVREGIAIDDSEGWTRPHLHILLDLQVAVMNTRARDALRFLESVYGDDAVAMLTLFAASTVVVSIQPETVSEADFVHSGLSGVRADARHPHSPRAAA